MAKQSKYKKRRYLQRVGCKQNIVFDILDKIKEYTPNYNKDLIFVDVFGGGGAVSANATYYFNNIIYNEIDKNIVEAFIKIQDDSIIQSLKERWISREEFMSIKNKENKTVIDNILLVIWSFGNNTKGYLYGKDKEERKRLTHKIIFSKTEEEYKKYIKEYNDKKVAHFEKYGAVWDCCLYDNDWDVFKKLDTRERRYYKFGKRAKYKRKFYKGFDIKELIEKRGKMKSKEDKTLIKDIIKAQTDNIHSLEGLQTLERLDRLQSLERLERLERLQSLQSLERLDRLEGLEILQRLECLQGLEALNNKILTIGNSKIFINNKDYRDLKLPAPNECVLYLDPPYYTSQKHYDNTINYDAFIKWIKNRKKEGYTIFLSEYNFPFGRVIWEKIKKSFISQTVDKYTGTEKLYLI